MKQLACTLKVAALVAAVALTSCSKDAGEDNPAQPVRFGASVNQATAMTKAAGTSWAGGDAIGVFMVEGGTVNVVDAYANRQHTTTGGSAFTPVAGQEIYYPVDGSNVDFIAYYPFAAGQTLGTYAVDVATQTSQPAIDLLWSKTTTGFNKTSLGEVGLAFDHKLAKVVINIVQPSTLTPNNTGLTDGDLANLTVKMIGMNTKATFNLSTGALPSASYGTPASITPVPVTMGKQYEAIVLPATFAAAGSLTMEFALNNAKAEVFTWSCPANETFAAGSVHKYTMTVTRTGVNFTCTINPWDTTPAERTGTAE